MAISDGKSDMRLVSELPAPVAMMRRGLALDEGWGRARSTSSSSPTRAAAAWPTAAARRAPGRTSTAPSSLSVDKKLGPRVACRERPRPAAGPRRLRAQLEEVLRPDVDSAPEFRLANLIAQRRARALLAHVDDLFA